MNMHEKIQRHSSLRDRLLESEQLMKQTGCYDGVTELKLRQQDPLKFETLHTKLRSFCVSAREMARRISASPGVREVGEMVVAIYTPEGDAVALSNGIMVHVHTMSRFIKWMIRNGYEAIRASGTATYSLTTMPLSVPCRCRTSWTSFRSSTKASSSAGRVRSATSSRAAASRQAAMCALPRNGSRKACSSAPRRSARTTRSAATMSSAASATCACRSTGCSTRRRRSPPASRCARACGRSSPRSASPTGSG